MGNVIVQGYKTNKLISQGYHSGEALPAVEEAGVIKGGPVPQPPIPFEIISAFKDYLEVKLGG